MAYIALLFLTQIICCSFACLTDTSHAKAIFCDCREVDQEQTDMGIYTSKEGKCCVLFVYTI